MNATPAVSVIIPAYNHERYVVASIESVLGQTLQDFEIVLVDDASRDKTWELASALTDPRIRLIRHPENRGAHAGINRGVSESRGKYIAILNSDDIFGESRLDALVRAAAAAASDDFFAMTDIEFIDSEGRPVAHDPRAAGYRKLREFCLAEDPSLWFLSGNPAVSSSNLFFSRALFDRIGGFAALRYTHDWEWATRAAAWCTPVWLRESLLSYRIHPSNTLGEADAWRHIHENSFVQAAALMRLPDARPGLHTEANEAAALCQALLRNESLHPVSLMCFLAMRLGGVDEPSLLRLAAGTDGRWILESIAESAGYPADVFRSGNKLIENVQQIASQAKLIEERWQTIQHMNGEIADRDEWIADLNERLKEIPLLHELIATRDREIGSLQSSLRASNDELAALHASRLVRGALALRDFLCKVGVTKGDPRLRTP